MESEAIETAEGLTKLKRRGARYARYARYACYGSPRQKMWLCKRWREEGRVSTRTDPVLSLESFSSRLSWRCASSPDVHQRPLIKASKPAPLNPHTTSCLLSHFQSATQRLSPKLPQPKKLTSTACVRSIRTNQPEPKPPHPLPSSPISPHAFHSRFPITPQSQPPTTQQKTITTAPLHTPLLQPHLAQPPAPEVALPPPTLPVALSAALVAVVVAAEAELNEGDTDCNACVLVVAIEGEGDGVSVGVGVVVGVLMSVEGTPLSTTVALTLALRLRLTPTLEQIWEAKDRTSVEGNDPD